MIFIRTARRAENEETDWAEIQGEQAAPGLPPPILLGERVYTK
jgi:hypothetical protein